MRVSGLRKGSARGTGLQRANRERASALRAGSRALTPGPGCQPEGSCAQAEERAGWARVGEGQVLGRTANGPGCGAAEEKKRGRESWARVEGVGPDWFGVFGLDWSFSFSSSISFPFLFLIQTKLNLFEFKFEFEFKPHSIK